MNPAAIAFVLTGIVGVGLPANAAETRAPPEVTVVRAKNACFSASIRVTGFLVAREEAVVSLDAPGFRVTEVMASEGDRVSNGQALVRLTRQGEAPQPAAPGSPPGAAAQGAGPTTVTLKAPVSGVVIRSTAVMGWTASPLSPEPLYRIAVDNDVELEADVPSIHVPVLSPGQIARVLVENNRALSGRVRLVPAAVDQRTQIGRARISLERDPNLRFGMFARASIDANRSCGISVPRSAVIYRTEGTRVHIVRDNLIETRPVVVGYQSDNDIEIREGLREGDLVVANSGSSLRDGDKVKPVETNTNSAEPQ
jgi:multidrug efflux pump subunit AcrA (membrane-fusion protein)